MAKDELFDDELCSMVHFTDEQQINTKSKQTGQFNQNTETLSDKTVTKPQGSVKYEPESETSMFQCKHVEPLKECAKHIIPLGCMSLIVFYWQQSGQMLASASMPCIYVFAILAGISIGKLFGSIKNRETECSTC